MTAQVPEPEEIEDTVIGAKAHAAVAPSSPDEDTIITGGAVAEGGPAATGDTAAPYPLVEPAVSSHPAVPSDPGTDDSVVATEWEPPAPGRRCHAIRIGTHDPIPLDVPAFIGRRPSTPRITGGRHPRLVRVPSLSREISSTHLEIRQEGSIVVVTDLDSTNGTVVTSPGGQALKLRQGESVVVVAGSVVDIGDDVRIEILPLPEAAP